MQAENTTTNAAVATQTALGHLIAAVGEKKALELDRLFPEGDEVRDIIFKSAMVDRSEMEEEDASDAMDEFIYGRGR